MAVEHFIVKSLTPYLSDVAHLLAPGVSSGDHAAFVTYLGTANRLSALTTMQEGLVLHYDPSRVPSPPTSTQFEFGPGGAIIAPGISSWVALGFNVGADMVPWDPPTYAFTNQGHVAQNHAEYARSIGVTCVRLNVLVIGDRKNVPYANMRAGVDAVVAEYTAHKIVVLIDAHDLTGKGGRDVNADPTWQEIHRFWADVASRHKDNPYVWCDYTNETYTDWNDPDPRWASDLNVCYGKLRSVAPNMPMVWQAPYHGQGLDRAVKVAPAAFKGKTRLILGWHHYGVVKPAAADVAVAALHTAGIPVMVGEVGCYWRSGQLNPRQPGAPNPIGVTQDGWPTMDADERAGLAYVTANARTQRIGMLVWHGTGAEDLAHSIYGIRTGGSQAFFDTTKPFVGAGAALASVLGIR